jgi:hypothetical protein
LLLKGKLITFEGKMVPGMADGFISPFYHPRMKGRGKLVSDERWSHYKESGVASKWSRSEIIKGHRTPLESRKHLWKRAAAAYTLRLSLSLKGLKLLA